MRNIALIFCLVAITSLSGYAQSKKKLRTYGITKKIETVVKYDNGIAEEPYVSEVEMFNSDGEWIERIDYQKDGDIKKRRMRRYEKGLLVEELEDEPLEKEWTEKTPDFKHRVYTFDKEDLIEEKEVNRKGEVKEKKVYIYNKYGDQITEITTDKKGDLVETETYSYDAKGFKTEKRTVTAEGELVEIKTYTYE